MSTPTRVKAGVPTGGQFAQRQHTESPVSLGADPIDFDPWDTSGNHDPYTHWTAGGFSKEDADRLRKADISVTRAKFWRDAGADIDMALEFQAAGYTPDTAKQWIQNKISADDSQAWINHGATKAWVAAKYRDEGFTPEAASGFIAEKFTAAAAVRWRDAGLDGDAAREWADDGMEMALEWNETHTSEEASAWVEVGITRARVAERWDARQQSPADVERWLQVGMYRPDLAEPWIRNGFDSGETFQWTAQQFDADQAAGCRASGMTPRQAIEFALAGMAS